MSFWKTIGHWFTKSGWIGRIFDAQNAKEINLKEIAAKGVKAIGTVLLYESQIKLISSAFSDNVEASTIQVIEVFKGLQERLQEIETIVDVAENLQDFTFSENAETDDFIKDELMLVALATEDGVITKLEAIPIITRAIEFVKSKNQD